MAYITTTHLLERIQPETLVVNDPAAVRNAPEKVFVLDFLDLMPPTLVTRSPDADPRLPRRAQGHRGEAALRQWRRRDLPHRAGRHQSQLADRAVRDRASASRSWCSSICPEVREGDKRIILVDGEVAGAINRVPAPDETRSNLHVGGTAQADRR